VELAILIVVRTGHIVKTHKERFPGYHLFLVTGCLLHQNHFLFLRTCCWKKQLYSLPNNQQN